MARIIGGVTLITAAWEVYRWLSRVAGLQAAIPVWCPLSPAMAVAVLLAGSALLLLASGKPMAKRASTVFAGILLLLSGWRFQVAFSGGFWQNFAFSDALAAFFIAGALLVSRCTSARCIGCAQILALTAASDGLFTLLGYVCGVPVFVLPVPGSQVTALPAALLCIALVIGILALHPRLAFMAVVTDAGAGGVMVRRLLPLVVLVPMLLGALRVGAEHARVVDVSTGVALFALAVMVLFTVAVWAVGKLLVGLDATRREASDALETEREFLKVLLENLHEGILACDAHGTITLYNRATRQIHTLLGKAIPLSRWNEHYDFRTSDGDRRLTVEEMPLFRALQGEIVRDVEIVVASSNGIPRRVVCSGQAMCDSRGRKLGAMVTMSDMTERRRAEQALREAHEELEKRVAERTEDLAKAVANLQKEIVERQCAEHNMLRAKQQAEAANAAKTEFLSRMSHELRTPLHAIIGFAQVMEMDGLTGEQEVHVGHIMRAGTHLLEVVNEVLDISRIENGSAEVPIQRVPLAGVVEEAIDLVRAEAARRKITILVEPSVRQSAMAADRRRLKQVLINLCSNAVKYNREGGSVTLFCEPAADSTRALHVRDTGPGLSAEKLSRIFTPFDRLGAEQHGVAGTGLGLAASQHLMQSMQGTLTVRSIEGRGSIFTLMLPDAPMATAEEAPVAMTLEEAMELGAA